MKKRWISLLLALAVMSVFIPTIYAGAAETSGVPLTITSGNISSENNLMVSVNVGPNSEASLIQFCIVFDAEKLNIESCSAGSVMAGKSPVINYNSEHNPNKIYFVWDAIDPITAEGSLLNIAFSLKESEAIGTEFNISFAGDEDFSFEKIISENPEDTIPVSHEDIAVVKTNGKITVVKSHAVSGTLTSWNNTDDAKIMIYPADTADSGIKTDIELSAPVLGTPATKGAVTANADGKRFDQTYSFSAVAEGSNKLAVYKPGKYVVKIIPITLGSADYNVNTQIYSGGECKLWLYGDVTYDGLVDAIDAMQIQRYYAGKTSQLTNGTVLDQNDRQKAADVNFDEVIDAVDAVQIQRYYAGKTSAINGIL